MGNSASALSNVDELRDANVSTARLSGELNNKALASIQRRLEEQYPWASNIEESVCITDPTLPDNPIVYVSDAFELLSGYPKELIVGRNCRFLQGKFTDPESVSKMSQALANKTQVEVELLNYRRDGTPFLNHFIILPLWKAKRSKKLTNFVAIQKDITALHANEDPAKWNSTEVALWLEEQGFAYVGLRFIEGAIDGARLLKLRREDLPALGVEFRNESHKLAKLISNLKHKKPSKKTSMPAGWEKRDEVTTDVDLERPRELSLWEAATATDTFLAMKLYYRDRIEVIRVERNIKLKVLLRRIQRTFDNLQMRIRWIDPEGDQVLILVQGDLNAAISATAGTTMRVRLEPEPFASSLASNSDLGRVKLPLLVGDPSHFVVGLNDQAADVTGLTKEQVASSDNRMDTVLRGLGSYLEDVRAKSAVGMHVVKRVTVGPEDEEFIASASFSKTGVTVLLLPTDLNQAEIVGATASTSENAGASHNHRDGKRDKSERKRNKDKSKSMDKRDDSESSTRRHHKGH
jgi:PAS domain S-box-containing protein